MKGLDWFKVSTEIGVDGDLEHVSDAAFRTYIELLAASVALLSDGRVALRDARKRCNTRKLTAALGELESTGHVTIDDETIILPKYGKWQRLREEVEAERETRNTRIRRYRERGNGVTNAATNGVTNATRVEKSREEKKEELAARQDAGTLTAYFVDQSRALGSAFTAADKGQVARYCKELLDQGIPYAQIQGGIDRMLERSLAPRLLGQLTNEAKERTELDLVLEANRNPRRIR